MTATASWVSPAAFHILPPSRIMAGMEASMMTSEGTCKLVMPLSEFTMATSGRAFMDSSRVASIAARSCGGISGSLAIKSPNPLLKFTPAFSKASACWATTCLKKTRTAAPKRMGSDTFIMVAFMCNENKAPSFWMMSSSFSRKASIVERDKLAASRISPACKARPCLSM